MSIKLDGKQQEQIIQDLKSHEVSEELLDTVAGGIINTGLPGSVNRFLPYTTLALGEESGSWPTYPLL